MILHVFNRRDAYLLTFSCMLLGLFGVGLLQTAVEAMSLSRAAMKLILVLGELLILLPLLLVLRERKLKLKQILPLKRINNTALIMAVLITVGALSLSEWMNQLIDSYLPAPELLKSMETELMWKTVQEGILLVVAGVLVAPVVEEIIFRGFLQQSVVYSYGSLFPGMIVSTAIFSLFHIQYLIYLPTIVELVALAIILSWVVGKTGNIYSSMLMHAIYNLFAFIRLASTQSSGEAFVAGPPVIWLVFGIITFTIGFVYFKRTPIVYADEIIVIDNPPIRVK